MMRNLNNPKPTNVIHDNPQPPDDALIQKFLEAKQDEALLKQLFIQTSQIKASLATWKAIIAAVLLDETKRNVILIDCLKYSFGLLSDHSIQEQYEIISIIDYIVRLIPNRVFAVKLCIAQIYRNFIFIKSHK